MALATSLINAAQNLINTFGNNASLYTYSSATKTSDTEGQVTVSSWGTATTIKVVDGGTQGSTQTRTSFGFEQIGEDEKIIRNDVTIAINDRLTYNGEEYRVMEIRSERVESLDVIQIIKVSQQPSTTSW